MKNRKVPLDLFLKVFENPSFSRKEKKAFLEWILNKEKKSVKRSNSNIRFSLKDLLMMLISSMNQIIIKLFL
jgi:DNA-binding winged helix-turn-helix (wHTH) protein